MTAVAVLGLGSIGLRHAKNLLAAGVAVAGFDPDPERRALLAKAGGEAVDSAPEALGESDMAVIASPNPYHLDDLRAAAEAGCHALVEKPLAPSDAGVETVLGDCAARGLVVYAAMNLRHHPAVRRAREIVAADELGDCLWARFQMSDYLPAWRPNQDHRTGYAADPATGGVLFDVVHEFDLAEALLGAAETVAAAARATGTLGIASEDCADVVLRHDNGVLTSLHLDYVTQPRCRAARVVGVEGILDLDLDARRLTVTGAGGDIRRDEQFPGSYDDDYVAEIESFLACARGEATPPCDGRAALKVLRQVLKAREMCGLPQA